MTPDERHCLAKITELASDGEGARRAVFQLGYNLGRLSELGALGREPCWDAWKEAVAQWDPPALQALAHNLRKRLELREGSA